MKGDDGGCFEAALRAVRTYGGVLEHPAASAAWKVFDLNAPPPTGGWVNADFSGGFTCHVEQGFYGHPARKATWLYAVVPELPSLRWGEGEALTRLECGFHSTEERRAARAAGVAPVKRISRKAMLWTPEPFRDLLLSIAGSVQHHAPAQHPRFSLARR